VAGGLDPDEPVRVGDWDAFHPFDGDGPLGSGAHHRALTSLGIACDEYGVARDPERLVPLDAIATALISLSDNAAPDYLRARLGDEALRAAAERTPTLPGPHRRRPNPRHSQGGDPKSSLSAAAPPEGPFGDLWTTSAVSVRLWTSRAVRWRARRESGSRLSPCGEPSRR
jgi:hypothetical protein